MGRNSEWKVVMWQALAQICVCMCVCVCVCVSLEHYSQMFGRLSYGLLISKRSQDKKQLVFFFFLFLRQWPYIVKQWELYGDFHISDLKIFKNWS